MNSLWTWFFLIAVLVAVIALIWTLIDPGADPWDDDEGER